MAEPRYYAGLDPGKSGAVALVTDGGTPFVHRLDGTLRDLWLWSQAGPSPAFAVLERVSAMPRQGVSSTFKFGTSYGHCEMLLAAWGVPHERYTPAQWQKAMRCLSRGDKNATKRRAQELFPAAKVTHHTADALLLAEFCRRLVAEGRAGELEGL